MLGLFTTVVLLGCVRYGSGRECLDKYRAIHGHTACISLSSKYESGNITQQDKQVIVEAHNMYRSRVNDTTNMEKMVWDDEIAMIAQVWAENCDFSHDKERSVPGKYTVGQNLGSGYGTWSNCIKAWYDEVSDFTYDSNSLVLSKVGHYTQLAWATSARIGCGFATCSNLAKHYVCNYGPAGNIGGIKKPYKQGTKASACVSKKNADGLCDCGGKTCYNGGELNLETCQCTCNSRVKFYAPETNCSLECNNAEDPFYCESQYKVEGCTKYSNVPYECPNMCKMCPWAGIHYVEGSVAVPASGSIIESSTYIIVLLLHAAWTITTAV